MASLYRHFDASGQLLYVGIAKNALCRLRGHKSHASWYRDLVRLVYATQGARHGIVLTQSEALGLIAAIAKAVASSN